MKVMVVDDDDDYNCSATMTIILIIKCGGGRVERNQITAFGERHLALNPIN